VKALKKTASAAPVVHANKQLVRWIFAATLLIAAALLFTRLGHYALWDDEAVDALGAQGILQTCDTTATLGHNIMAYRNGLLMKNLRTEGEPPFTAYASAISMKVFGETAWAARLPIALFGFAAVALILWWIWKLRIPPLIAAAFGIGLLCNVSFLLYARQCHYYGVAIFCFVAIPYIYFNWRGRKSMLVAMGACSALLLAANYSFFLVLYACLFADYVIWQRKVRKFSVTDVAVVVALPFLTGLAMMAWWNPFHTQIGGRLAHDTFSQRITLFIWHWRDLNRCEMFSGLLLLLAPIVAFVRRDAWLKRALFALGLYVVGMTVLSTQSVTDTSVSDVRYFSALIPLFVFVEVLTIRALTAKSPWLAVPVALVAFGTNLLNGGPLFQWGFRSTPANYIGELLHPPGDPYTVAAKWIHENVREGESIWVVPDYMNYPLMFHEPKAVYAWQLAANNHEPQFAGLPPIHFQGRVPPDYIIAFGPVVEQLRQSLEGWQGVRYEQTATLDFYWKDMYRPELFWRTFKPVTGYDKETDAIYVFKLKGR
jgi:4-amino-4-deoxy-L-arabinose transferase-like glycosyltransferase